MKQGLPRVGIKRILANTLLSSPSLQTVNKKSKNSKKRKRATLTSSTTATTANTATATTTTTASLTTNLQWPNVTLDTLSECSVEFVLLVIAEANEQAQQVQQSRNNNDKSVTIGPDIIFAALKTLGFDSYIKNAKAAGKEMDNILEIKKKQKKKRMKGTKLTKKQQQNIAKQQALLFAAAADAFDGDEPR